ncbi:hypothetical protein G6F31_015693 [Rhizopus arrhizus]|nr:hypothetical protein G6F31_015693 [Rhizopus arrhizus]
MPEAGLQAYAAAVTAGQHTHPDGLFYGGTGPAASLLNLRSILGEYVGPARTQVAWIDVHTGLGPRGHGEKIYAGKRDAAGVALARQWWGADLTVPFLGNSASADVTGYVGGLLHEAGPAAGTAVISLEFGTVPLPDMVQALRGRHSGRVLLRCLGLARHGAGAKPRGGAASAVRAGIRRAGSVRGGLTNPAWSDFHLDQADRRTPAARRDIAPDVPDPTAVSKMLRSAKIAEDVFQEDGKPREKPAVPSRRGLCCTALARCAARGRGGASRRSNA